MRTYIALHLNYDTKKKTISLEVGDEPALEKRVLLTVATDLEGDSVRMSLMSMIESRVMRTVNDMIKRGNRIEIASERNQD